MKNPGPKALAAVVCLGQSKYGTFVADAHQFTIAQNVFENDEWPKFEPNVEVEAIQDEAVFVSFSSVFTSFQTDLRIPISFSLLSVEGSSLLVDGNGR